MRQAFKWQTFGAVAVLALAGGDAAAQAAGMEARLTELESEAEIRRLLDDYMMVLGAREWDAYVQFFTADGELDMAEGVVKGRDAIRTRMANASARMASAAAGRPQRQSADLLSNVYVKVDGDSATARSRFTFLAEGEDGSFRVGGSGLYLDTWKRENGAWKIARRTVSWDLLAGAGAAPPAAPGSGN
jgi:3-phenylpropionate/cinnamic acid dioxygenase small subunit